MTTSEAIVSIVGTLAWPASIITIAIIIRRDMKKASNRRKMLMEKCRECRYSGTTRYHDLYHDPIENE